jgi:hypothetical protein
MQPEYKAEHRSDSCENECADDDERSARFHIKSPLVGA